MHPEARNFTLFVKSRFPEFFANKKVLDVGSGDINGNNRFLFDNCEYDGNDVFAASNVTIVSKTSALPFGPETFDTIISTECFEHDPEYSESFQKILSMLKPGGLFLFTCASTGRWEHGTRRTSPGDSYGTIGNVEGWTDYYKNLTIDDVKSSIDINEFNKYDDYYHPNACDLYFWGIKKGGETVYNIKTYEDYLKEPQRLDNIFFKYPTDKGPSFHNYTRQYEGLLAPLRERPIRILEIGIYKGASLLAWRDAFPKAQCIVGVDITASCKNYENVNNGIFVEILDATSSDNIDILKQKYGYFDLILDDGSHINEDVIRSFEGLFPALNDEGIYIVEDTICYKSSGHINPAYPNHIDYFTRYIPYLNQWRFDSTIGIQDHCIDPFKIQKKTDNIFERTIDKIEFGCSYIAVFKQTRHHWI